MFHPHPQMCRHPAWTWSKSQLCSPQRAAQVQSEAEDLYKSKQLTNVQADKIKSNNIILFRIFHVWMAFLTVEFLCFMMLLFREVTVPCCTQLLLQYCHCLHRSQWTAAPAYSNSTWSDTETHTISTTLALNNLITQNWTWFGLFVLCMFFV